MKKITIWQSVPIFLGIASVFYCSLLIQNKKDNARGLERLYDLEDADVLLNEYPGYTIRSSVQINSQPTTRNPQLATHV